MKLRELMDSIDDGIWVKVEIATENGSPTDVVVWSSDWIGGEGPGIDQIAAYLDCTVDEVRLERRPNPERDGESVTMLVAPVFMDGPGENPAPRPVEVTGMEDLDHGVDSGWVKRVNIEPQGKNGRAVTVFMEPPSPDCAAPSYRDMVRFAESVFHGAVDYGKSMFRATHADVMAWSSEDSRGLTEADSYRVCVSFSPQGEDIEDL